MKTKTATLSDVIDAHRSAIEMAAKKRTLPQLAEWFWADYQDEIEGTGKGDMETLCSALLQFYP